jgi:hypothetical protein
MATSVTLIFLNSLWGRPSLFFGAVLSVRRRSENEPQTAWLEDLFAMQ